MMRRLWGGVPSPSHVSMSKLTHILCCHLEEHYICHHPWDGVGLSLCDPVCILASISCNWINSVDMI